LERLFPGLAPVLLDGATGTALRELGWPVSAPTVLANLEAPALVATIHDGYRAAGARVLHTNTFGALLGIADDPPLRLQATREAVRLARAAAGRDALVAGSLGAYDLAFHGPHLQDVVRVLVDEGVDLLVFETCNSVRDAGLALEVRAALAPRLPLVVCCSSTDGSRADHDRVHEALALLDASGDDVEPGLNCCRGPHELYKLATAQGDCLRWLKPSAGAPDDPVDDNVMAAFARAACQAGARWIGSCCGTDAGTTALIGAALRG
jgi:methionine synthase / methylenetetrahydrofolate reductase(NADPH)